MQPILIAGYNQGGLVRDRKPFLLPNQAFSRLENAVVWRDAVIRRRALKTIGRLQKTLTSYSFFAPSGSPWTFSLKVVTGFVSGINIGAAPTLVVTTTYPHGLSNGDSVVFTGIVGTTQLNGNTYVIANVTASTFEVTQVAPGVYVSGGKWISNRSLTATEPNAQIAIGSVTITLAGPIVLIDQSDGTLATSPASANTGTINYNTGSVTITYAGAPASASVTYSYYPSLPCQGITTREIAGVNNENYIFYDTKYAYKYTTAFEEYIPGTTWQATNADFFWYTNYRGTNSYDRLYFVTDFVNDANNPIRYTDGSTWNDFAPITAQSGGVGTRTFITQARVIIPYYGRLLMLNVYECGATVGGTPDYATSQNIFNRCRFSQIGNPIAADAWRSDQFGKGGFIDAPTNEAIVSATFIKNTLLVQFERSTWQLRYVGEYGLPFIWERVSSDFGCDSTFSTVLFDNHVLAVGDKAIVASNANTVERIDEQNPDTVFEIQNKNSGTERVQGVRDFFKEMVYWNYPDSGLGGDSSYELTYPNKVLVYNYRSQTYAIFDDRVTAFGQFQSDTNTTWDSLVTYWDDEETFWDDDPDQQSRFPMIACGNQQGYIHQYNDGTVEPPSLSITAIDTTVTPNTITVPSHNLENTFASNTGIQPNDEGYTVKITGTLWDGVDPGLDDQIFGIMRDSANVLSLYFWSGTMYEPTPVANPAAGTYIGGGELTVFPQLFIQSKDFNPFIEQQINIKLIYADFLTDYAPRGEVAVELYMNTSYNVKANVKTGQRTFENYLPAPYYTQGSDLAWHRLYATCQGQFVRVCITMNDDQMSDQDILNSNFRLNAMNLWIRPGGKTVFT